MEMWLHQPGAAAGGPSVTMGHCLCHLSVAGSTGRCMAQQHAGGTQQPGTPIKSQPLGFFPIHPPATIDSRKPGVWHLLRSRHLSTMQCGVSVQSHRTGPLNVFYSICWQWPWNPTVPYRVRPACRVSPSSLLTAMSLQQKFNALNLFFFTKSYTRRAETSFVVWLLNKNEPEKGPVSQQRASDARENRRTTGKRLNVSQHER